MQLKWQVKNSSHATKMGMKTYLQENDYLTVFDKINILYHFMQDGLKMIIKSAYVWVNVYMVEVPDDVSFKETFSYGKEYT